MPGVSIIIPTYNSARFLPATLESVFNQTYRDYEVLVVDDGSTDNTREVLAPYLERIIYIYQENSERSAARNNALSHANGDLIAFIDSDDLWQPEKLERQVAVMDAYPEVALVFCQSYYIDESGARVAFCGNWIDGKKADGLVIANYYDELMLGNVVSCGSSTAVMRRRVLDQAGWFDVMLSDGEDWDVWLRLSRFGPFAYIPEPLSFYRVFGWKKVLTSQSMPQAIAQHLRVIEKNLPDGASDRSKREEIKKVAEREIYLLAALGNYQLGNYPSAAEYLERAAELDPKLRSPEEIMRLAVDRAKIIERDSGSYTDAIAFVHQFLSHLPPSLANLHIPQRQAEGWLYVSGAFEQHSQKNDAAVRSLLSKGILRAPQALRNRGVLSILADATLGRSLAARLKGKSPE